MLRPALLALVLSTSVLADEPPKLNAARELKADAPLLLLPVDDDAPRRAATVRVDGVPVRRFALNAAHGAADWHAQLDVSAWQGKTLAVDLDELPAGSRFLEEVRVANALPDAADLYREPFRQQSHFSTRRGWLNNPNGLCASSTDGRTFVIHPANPVLPALHSDNRDPKISWHTPAKHWVMALWVPAPTADGRQSFVALVDRGGYELFPNGGRQYVPVATAPKAESRTLTFAAPDGGVTLQDVEVHALRSAWEK